MLSAAYSNPQSLIPNPSESYTYDANGNRITANGSTYTTGVDNQLLSDGTYYYVYDAEGNRIAKFIDTDADGLLDEGDTDITGYRWDARERLTEVTTYAVYGGSATEVVDYYYDAENRWIVETIDSDGDGLIDQTIGFAYDGDQIALQFERGGEGLGTGGEGAAGSGEGGTGSASVLTASDLSHRYLWLANAVDQLMADEQLAGTDECGTGSASEGYDLTTPGDVLWPLADQQGTIRDLAETDDGITSIVNHRVYDSYGNLKSETNEAVDCLFGYTGRAWDGGSKTWRSDTRPYDPSTGRWTQEDPIGFNGRDANVNRYVGNSPVNRTDPSGLDPAFAPTIGINSGFYRANLFSRFLQQIRPHWGLY